MATKQRVHNLVVSNCSAKNELFAHATPTMDAVHKDLRELGWVFHIVAGNTGRCYYQTKTITVGLNAIRQGVNVKNWMLSHEMAHVFAGYDASHGPLFMKELKLICPPEAIVHEFGYKPAQALKAGFACFIADL
jgi:hypothetical protein